MNFKFEFVIDKDQTACIMIFNKILEICQRDGLNSIQDLSTFNEAARKWFLDIDRNLDSMINLNELRREFMLLGQTEAETDSFLKHLDRNEVMPA